MDAQLTYGAVRKRLAACLVSGRVEHQSASWAMDRSGSARFVVDSIA